jgi:Lysyl oxidase
MRWIAGSAVLAAVVAAVLATQPWAGSQAGTQPLLPDLDQASPSALSLRREGRRTLLVFGSAVDNVGTGPLLIEANRRSRSDARMQARQAIVRSDRSRVYRDLGRLLWYERAETHSHWHLHHFARYELRTADGSDRLLRSTKMGFCLGDRYDANRRVRMRGEPAEAVWTHECGRGRPDLLTLSEGISVGFGDDYDPYLEGQYVDVTRLPAGRYVLVHTANYVRHLRESDYGNNSASVLLALRRSEGRPVSVRVLRRCPGSATCAL